ncbi:hypothetical protein CK203_084566 [Vitis vinifera]|uniref:Uncharacterized protein n=1 Tax=Vitis vinifera TaxID=29760 RepID=A0A438DNQ2_VITVI|nr:hypothetical protein CK203_084566 [Vitis vinifera]
MFEFPEKRAKKKEDERRAAAPPPPAEKDHHRQETHSTHGVCPSPLVILRLGLSIRAVFQLSSLSHRRAASIPTTAGAAVAESDIGHFGVTRRCGDPVPSKLVRQTILDRVFNGTSPFYSFPPPHVAHLLRPKRIKWWGSNGAVFENLIRRVKPRTIIDVGTFLGASAIHMARLGPARHAF